MIKCILFDLGGVIVDYTDDRYYYPYLSKVSGMSMERIKSIVKDGMEAKIDVGKMTQMEFDREVADKLGIEPEQVKWYGTFKKIAKPNRGTLSVAKRLHRNYSVSYLSNVDRSRYRWVVGLLKPYNRMFDRRFASCAIGLRKPTAAIYNYALRKMGFKADEVVFVDNLEANVRGARRVGIKSILFTNVKDLKKQLGKMGVRL